MFSWMMDKTQQLAWFVLAKMRDGACRSVESDVRKSTHIIKQGLKVAMEQGCECV